jgi:hypothetical protein
MLVFRTLMGTRRTPLTPEHVGALNLVEIEFHNDSEVISAWRKYMEHLGSPILTGDADVQRRFFEERSTQFTKLLHTVGKSLGYQIEQLEILQGGYAPRGWEDERWEQRELRRLLIETLQGSRAIPITQLQKGSIPNPYPPPPSSS